MTKTQIWNYNHTQAITVPASCQRLCAQCLDPMPINYYHWSDQTTVEIVYLCQHKLSARFKRVQAKLDKKGRLS